MKITFVITIDELVGYSLYTYKKLGNYKRNLCLSILFYLFFFGIIFVLFYMVLHFYKFILFSYSILCAIFIFNYPLIHIGRYRSNLAKHFKKDEEKIIEENNILINEKEFIISSNSSSTTFKNPFIKNITDINDCLYLHTSELNAIIIPKRIFDDERKLSDFKNILDNFHIK